MVRWWQLVLGALAASLAVAAPLVFSAGRQYHLRNFRVVEDGKLYRSGQLSPAGMERVLHDYGIKTVVTLRASRDPALPCPDAWEAEMCAARGVRHVRIVPRVWGADEKGEVPAERGVREFLAVMDDPANHPVLLHCFAGVHRTGTMCALYRMEYNRWPVDRATAEMEWFGYDPADLHEHVRTYLNNYRPRWKRAG
jgi:tyrosine-protein phosphatase SIW14